MMVRIGEIYISDDLLGRFNCGHLVIGKCNINKYCPECLDHSLDKILEQLEEVITWNQEEEL